ncbi:MAG: energy-coupling factor ABC transporter ATP-binding protein [Dictyoglomaceae bacterium]|nr:energy-coupling factor ABC transporter ATP-binding protein [Dictyoglomaceae bacterium]
MRKEELIFKLEDVSYYYIDHKIALSSINLEIYKGERICILGPNGSGKSTLLKILDGLIYPQRGKFWAFSREISEKTFNEPEFNMFFRKNVVLLFQNVDAQLFSPRVRDEISLSLIQLERRRKDIEEKIDQVSEIFRISHLLDKTPYQLSEGEKKKVALASIFVIEPSVILLDEPTNGLDPRSAREFIEYVKNLQRQGKTTIIATHDLNMVSHIADKIYVLNEEKKIIRSGKVEEILEDKSFLEKVNLI